MMRTNISPPIRTRQARELEPPKQDVFKKWLDDAQKWATQSGLTKDSVFSIIAEVRARKHSCV